MENIVIMSLLVVYIEAAELTASSRNHSALSIAIITGTKAQKLIERQEQLIQQQQIYDDITKEIGLKKPFEYNTPLKFFQIYKQSSTTKNREDNFDGQSLSLIENLTPNGIIEAVRNVSENILKENPKLREIVNDISKHLQKHRVCTTGGNVTNVALCATIRKFIRVLQRVKDGYVEHCTLARPKIVGHQLY